MGVGFTWCRSVSLHVDVEMNLDDLVGCEESVADALLEGVAVHRCAEVFDVRGVGRFLWGRGQADLRGAGEVLQNLPPRRVLGRATAVTLVNDDEVEELPGEFPIQFLSVFRAG